MVQLNVTKLTLSALTVAVACMTNGVSAASTHLRAGGDDARVAEVTQKVGDAALSSEAEAMGSVAVKTPAGAAYNLEGVPLTGRGVKNALRERHPEVFGAEAKLDLFVQPAEDEVGERTSSSSEVGERTPSSSDEPTPDEEADETNEEPLKDDAKIKPDAVIFVFAEPMGSVQVKIPSGGEYNLDNVPLTGRGVKNALRERYPEVFGAEAKLELFVPPAEDESSGSADEADETNEEAVKDDAEIKPDAVIFAIGELMGSVQVKDASESATTSESAATPEASPESTPVTSETESTPVSDATESTPVSDATTPEDA